MNEKTKNLFNFLYNNMLIDKEKNLSNYINDYNRLKEFEITQSNNEFDIIVRLFENNGVYATDIAVILGDKVLQKLFYNETNIINDCILEYRRLINFSKNNKIDVILEKSKKNVNPLF